MYSYIGKLNVATKFPENSENGDNDLLAGFFICPFFRPT